jgi:hypothetical protein
MSGTPHKFPRYFAEGNKPRRFTMPIFIPLLIGIPVVLAGGYYFVHVIH